MTFYKCVVKENKFIIGIRAKIMKIETMLGRRNTISSSSSGKFWPFSFKSSSFGSTVAIQKLRETKWFGEDEERIFCSVVESGFIVEINDESRENNFFGIVDFSVKKGRHKIYK